VVIFDEDRTATRAIVYRTRRYRGSREAARERKPVRFTCFEKLDAAGSAPQFKDCGQMATAGHLANTKCAPAAQHFDKTRTHDANELDVLLDGLDLN